MQQPEEQFDSLRRALRLKRHEQPPPGYFHSFSTQVIRRIRDNRGRERASSLDAASWEAPWFSRLLERFQARPALAGVLGASAFALLLVGVVVSEGPPAPQSSRLGNPQDVAAVGLNAPATPVLGLPAGPIGALPPGTTLFDRMRPLQSGQLQPNLVSVTNLVK